LNDEVKDSCYLDAEISIPTYHCHHHCRHHYDEDAYPSESDYYYYYRGQAVMIQDGDVLLMMMVQTHALLQEVICL
jgi:hypothetical protein